MSSTANEKDPDRHINVKSVSLARLLDSARFADGVNENIFWKLAAETQLPFYETLPERPDDTFCTFVYKGNEQTKDVRLHLPPFSRIFEESYRLTQISGTNIWYVSSFLPGKCRFAYSFVVNGPLNKVGPNSSDEERNAFTAACCSDDFNVETPGSRRSVITTAGAAEELYLTERSADERGRIRSERFISGVFGNERSISVYTTPNFDESRQSALLVAFDEEIYLGEMKAASVIDNLFHEGLIPQMVAVFIGNADGRRSIELGANPGLSRTVADELYPAIDSRFKLSERREHRIIAGASFGGLAALYVGLDRPALFGRVLSQSASLWRVDDELTRLLKCNKSTQRIYLEAGRYELEEINGDSLVEANRRFRDELVRADHEVIYREYNGGHGAASWRGTFPKGLSLLASGDKSVMAADARYAKKLF